jgi:hypothetical protein
VIRATTGEYLIDPDAVYLESAKEQPDFRVMAPQRLKSHGVRVVGCYKDTKTRVVDTSFFCLSRILVLFYTVNFTTYSSMVDYTILTLVPRQDTIHISQ